MTVGSDGTSREWDARIDRPELPLGAQAGAASGIAISPDGSILASVGADGDVHLWNLTTRQSMAPIVARGRTRRCGVQQRRKDRRGRRCGRGDSTLEAEEPPPDQAGSHSPGPCMRSHSRRTANGSRRRASTTSRVCSRCKEAARTISLPHTAVVNDVAFSADSKYLATAGADRLAHIWQVGTWQPTMTFSGHAAAINSVAFSN